MRRRYNAGHQPGGTRFKAALARVRSRAPVDRWLALRFCRYRFLYLPDNDVTVRVTGSTKSKGCQEDSHQQRRACELFVELILGGERMGVEHGAQDRLVESCVEGHLSLRSDGRRAVAVD